MIARNWQFLVFFGQYISTQFSNAKVLNPDILRLSLGRSAGSLEVRREIVSIHRLNLHITPVQSWLQFHAKKRDLRSNILLHLCMYSSTGDSWNDLLN